MSKVVLNTIGSRYGSIDALNDNFDRIEEAFNNTLSRDGSSPNAMLADLNMNGNSILNASYIDGDNISINGVPLDQYIAASSTTIDPNQVIVYRSTFVATANDTTDIPLVTQYLGPKQAVLVSKNGITQNPSTFNIIDGLTLRLDQPINVGESVDVIFFNISVGIQGPTGPQGPAGPIGPAGVAGPQGVGIASITLTSGTGAPGTTDTYTITFTDSTTSTFDVYNGADGSGSGTVTSITAGTGLTGGTITSNGTIAIDTAVVATLTGTQTLTGKTITFADNTLTGVQPTLVSGTSIKTINATSLLGSGDIVTGDVTLGTAQTITASKRGTVTTDNDLSFDMNVTNNFFCTTAGSGTLTFTNITAGQSGFILLVNASNHTISAASTTKITAADLTRISATGTYLVSYFSNGTDVFCVASGNLA